MFKKLRYTVAGLLGSSRGSIRVPGLTAHLLVVTALVGVSTLTGAGVAGAATAPSSCPSGHWPAAVEGRPPAAKVGMTGVALWHDRYGWHLRESEAGTDRAVFTGTVSTDGGLVSVRRHLEGGDATFHPGPHTLGYRFTNYGGVDGVDFGVACGSTIRVSAYLDGHAVPVSNVVIGAGNTHPAAMPIVIHKVAS
jgi:hypothetical protein